MCLNNFFIPIAMGKYNAHVLGALFVMLLLMSLETLWLVRRRKRILAGIRARRRARAALDFLEAFPEE
jgi:heme exporter protein D